MTILPPQHKKIELSVAGYDATTGLPDISWCNMPKCVKNIPNDHKINIPTFFISRPSKIYPN
jgi:hypothetical protein